MTDIKKTGATVQDNLSITRKKDNGMTFTIHFPSKPGEINESGVNVDIELDQLKRLKELVNTYVSWSCPKCGCEMHNYRRSELDWDYRRCDYCGFDER